MAKWKQEFNPGELVRSIEKTRIVADDGSISFKGWETKIHDTLLYSMIDFSEEIPEIDGRGIARKSIFDAGKKGEITPKSLLSEVNRNEGNYINLPIQRFVLATSISISQFTKLDRIFIGRIQIIFENHLPDRFIREAAELRIEAERILYADPPNNYKAVRVHVSAKSHSDAADKALDALDLIRGVWNLYGNIKGISRWSIGGKPIPINMIILGPYHTLHFPSGALASTSRWWFEPNYLGAVTPHRIENRMRLDKYTMDIRSRLDKSHYGKLLENAIIRYVRALDERYWNNAFIRLWGVLELLTDTVKKSNEETIKRAAYCHEDYDFTLQILKHLREHRNRSVHADVENSEMESFLYQLKNIIEVLIYFHLGNAYGFKSIKEAGNFLSLPHDKDALNLRVDLANYALKYLGHKR